MAVGIHHVQISIDPGEIARTRLFYIDLLGMREIHDPFPGMGFWLEAGAQQVHVRIEAGIERRKTNAHPAFLVEDLAACERAFLSNKFEMIPQPKIEGFERFHVIDPSGNRVEVMQKI